MSVQPLRVVPGFFKPYRDAVRSLVDLYTHGGIDIFTPDTGAPLAKTVIQPDGDFINSVSPTIEQRAWEAHLEAIKGKIDSIGRIRTLLRWLSRSRILSLLGVVYPLYNEPMIWKWTGEYYAVPGLLIIVWKPGLFLNAAKPMVALWSRRLSHPSLSV